MCGIKAAYDCIRAFSETDFTDDLRLFDVFTLILHGEDDQIVPLGSPVRQDREVRHAQNLPWVFSRNVHSRRRKDQQRPSGVPENAAKQFSATIFAEMPPSSLGREFR